MELLQIVQIQCPCCWESIDIQVDCSVAVQGERQEYVEDCQVCCNPLVIELSIDQAGQPEVVVRPEQD